MKKRIQALFLVLLLLVTTTNLSAAFPAMTAKAATKLTVNLHYQRSDKKYDNWNIWSWCGTTAGKQYDFSKDDDFGKVSTYDVELPDGAKQIGFIIRQSTKGNEWAAKDTDKNRFMDVSKAKDGVLDVYVISGQETFGYSEDDASKPKVTFAKAIDSKTISIKISAKTDEDLTSKTTVTDATGKSYKVGSIKLDDTKGTVTMTDEIDVTTPYTLTVEGYNDISVIAQNEYSTEEFESKYTYEGDDLGATWTKDKTTFKLWSPTASKVVLNLYKSGTKGTDDLIESIDMKQGDKGVWSTEKEGDLNRTYYTYSVTNGEDTLEAVDPYAKAVGVNGERGMVIDLDSTDPEGWDDDKRVTVDNYTDASIWEIHIRDFSNDPSSGVSEANRGKYLAFTESGTKNANGTPTGVDYLKSLGISHVQLMPSYDYKTVDETTCTDFNWGYDPKNYNAPEGSYSSDPYNGEVRVNEYKQMVQALHNAGIGVVMDVVYNHTEGTENLDAIVPDYYYRLNEDGSHSAGSGCGNDIASERSMARKMIVESATYWVTEYHLDGLRFDLSGLLDVQTMQEVCKAVHEIDPKILIYGEGWSMTTAVSKDKTPLCIQPNASMLTEYAFFSDNMRDGLKGSVFDNKQKGYVNGATDRYDKIIDCVKGTQEWAVNPTQAINYTSCHDNNTLWDKINTSNPDDSEEAKISQNLLAAAIIYTAQGIPFMQAGEEMLRTKVNDDGTFDSNSYKSSDKVNNLKWEQIDDNKEVLNYYEGLIQFRKAHSALRMTTSDDVNKYMKFVEEGLDDNVIAYEIDGNANNESADGIFVVYNPNTTETNVKLPAGDWNVYVNGSKAGTEVLDTVSGTAKVSAISCMVLVKESKTQATDKPSDDATTTSSDSSSTLSTPMVVGIVSAIVVVLAAIVVVLMRRKRR